MNQLGFRESSKLFTDVKHYPRGFRKSGDFSIAESDILAQFGNTLQLLASGELTAATVEEQQFVAVVRGSAQATTRVELAWMKYSRLTNHPRRFHTMNSRKLVDTEDYSKHDSQYDSQDNLQDNSEDKEIEVLGID